MRSESNIQSIGTAREARNKANRKKYLSPEERLGELEEEVLRLTEFSLEIQESLQEQVSRLNRLVRILRRRNRPTPSAGTT